MSLKPMMLIVFSLTLLNIISTFTFKLFFPEYDLIHTGSLLISLAIIGILVLVSYKRYTLSVSELDGLMLRVINDKDLSVDIMPDNKQAANSFKINLAQILNDLKLFISQTVQSAAKTSTAAEKLSIIIDQTNNGVSKQKEESEQLASAMNEMAATVQEVSRNASDAAQASTQADEAAQNGKNIVNKSIAGINNLASEVENTSNLLNGLQTETGEIDSVLSVIQSIAEQTNLLALNAAIEAARAGESGRGFAVVADEVRTLAQRSKESTEEIKAIIEKLQSGAQQAVLAMGAGLEQAAQSVEQADLAGKALDEITQSVAEIKNMNIQIATASEEQAAVTEEINKNIIRIVQIADETSNGAQLTAETTQVLASISMELQNNSNTYQLGSGYNALDLSKAKSAHLAWKARLRGFLDGEAALTQSEAVSHKHCVLGKWYYSEGLKKFGHLQEMLDVEEPHAKLHAIIKDIITEKEKGNHQQAEAIYSEVGPLSENIVSLLNQIEQKA